MTQGLQFSLLFSGLEALTTGDTAVLKSDMADSAATQQAAAFRQILQDEQYSKTVRQGQTFAATSVQQQGYSQAVGAIHAQESSAKVAQDNDLAASAVADSAVDDSAVEDSIVENSDLAEQWLGLIRQSGDASAQLKQKAEMAKLFFTAQPAAEAENNELVPEHFAKLAGQDNAHADIQDNGERMLSQKNQDLVIEKPAAQITSNTDMLAVTPEELTSETDTNSESLDATLDKTKAETDELAKKQQAKSTHYVTSVTQPGLPLASGATTATESEPVQADLAKTVSSDAILNQAVTTASLSQADSESKDKQNDTTLQAVANQATLAKNDIAKATLVADHTSQQKLTNVNEAAVVKEQTELSNQDKSAVEPKLAEHVTTARVTTAVKSDADIDTPSVTKLETVEQAIITTGSVNTASGSNAVLNTTADEAALSRVANLSEANVSAAQSKPSTEVVTEVTPESSEAKKLPDAMSVIRLAEQVGSTESTDVAPSNVATINVNVDGKTSVRDKSSANLAETVAVNTNKISGSKTDKGADTGDSQSEQQGQSRQDGRQYTFNRLDVTLTPNTAQPAASVATNASAQVNDTAGVIARAESFATVLEQQSRPQSAVAAPSLAAKLKQLNLQQQDAAGQLRERVQLMVRQNVQVAEIRLDPAELGQMQIRVNLQQEQASVQFIVQQQHAKELLEQQMPRLRELLQQQGIQLGEGQVQQQTREERQQAEQRSAGGSQHNDEKKTGTDNANQTTTVELRQSERLVDYYA